MRKFKVGQKVQIDWKLDHYMSKRKKVAYPKVGIITYITPRGLFVQAPSGVISMVGIYDLATGTKVKEVV